MNYLEIRYRPPTSLKQLKAYVAKHNRSGNNYLFGIFKKAISQHIGNIKLGPINKTHTVAEIGFLIGERKQRCTARLNISLEISG